MRKMNIWASTTDDIIQTKEIVRLSVDSRFGLPKLIKNRLVFKTGFFIEWIKLRGKVIKGLEKGIDYE